MTNLITGLIAIVMMIVFLGNYAVKINKLPLWIVILAILAMVITDFVISLRSQRGDNESGG